MKNKNDLHDPLKNAAVLSDEELEKVDGGVFLMPELEELVSLQKKEKKNGKNDDPDVPLSPKDMF